MVLHPKGGSTQPYWSTLTGHATQLIQMYVKISLFYPTADRNKENDEEKASPKR